MENKNKAIKRRQGTKRAIAKRMGVIKNQWRSTFQGFEEEHPWEHTPGRVDKHNLRCGCKMCRIKDRHPYKAKVLEEKAKDGIVDDDLAELIN